MIIEIAAGIILAAIVIVFWRVFAVLAALAFWAVVLGGGGLWAYTALIA